MSIVCEIEFENSPSKVIYSGQLLRGNVFVVLKEETVIQGVYLRLTGGASCRFEIVRSKVHLGGRGTEQFLDERIICFGGANEKVRLEPGLHCYPFECQLKMLMPTSLEEAHGSIRYTARIRFDEFWDSEPVHEETFTIIKPLHLNMLPSLHEPLSMEFTKKFYYFFGCCFPCCESDEIKMVARIPQQGYTPGQYINIQLFVDNKSSEEVRAIKARIYRKVTLFSNPRENGTRIERTDSTKLNHKIVEGFDSRKEEIKTYNFKIAVPPTPPTDEITSNIFKVFYILRVSAVVSLLHDDPFIDIPITIGTHPIAKSQWTNATNVFLRHADRMSNSKQAIFNQPSVTSGSNDGADVPLLLKVQNKSFPELR